MPRRPLLGAIGALLLTFAFTSLPASSRSGAAPAPLHLRAVVTGQPASAAFVQAQIERAVAQSAAGLAATPLGVQTVAIWPAPEPLDRGFQTSFTVSFASTPTPAKPALNQTAIVDVINVDLPGFAPTTLAFRDDPERIIANGVLSRTSIAAGHPTRVYYYHQNSGARRRFCVVISVNASVSTRLEAIDAAAGPNIDVMGVGHAVTRTFLLREPRNEGSVIDLAGGKPVLERDLIADPGQGIVGALDIRVLSGGPVSVTVLAIPPDADWTQYLYTAKLADDGHRRHGNFDLAGFARWIVAYTVGGPDAAYVYGGRGRTLVNRDADDPGRDYGDYGVLQRITFDLANPSAAPVTLYVYEKPLGGVVRSSFLVDGTLVNVGCVRIAARYEVAAYELGGRATATLDLLTMTDGGSNYPLEIGLTMTPPVAQAPPISAPDGCFPKPAHRPL